jgi:ABC-type phosphate transport system auxiliary subunit
MVYVCDKDFGNFLYNQYHVKKIYNDMSKAEKYYFKMLNENMIKKSSKRVEDIKVRIKNDIYNKIFNKKYQIQSTLEYMLINEYFYTLNIQKYKLSWCHADTGITRNKLSKIIEAYSGNPMKFINEKSLVMYCYFSKNV